MIREKSIAMNKKNERKSIISVNKRNNEALKSCKIATSLLKVNDDVQLTDILSRCNKQNMIIDVMCKNDKNINEIANMLLSRNMFTSLDYAIKRVKRHIKNDRKTAIAKRMISIVSM